MQNHGDQTKASTLSSDELELYSRQISVALWDPQAQLRLKNSVVFVAGAPLVFDLDDLAATYEGRRGGILWAASVEDGSRLAQYELKSLPAWDGMAAAYGRLFIVNQDGSIECWGTDGD